ncbi:cytochrome p450 domain-containing protein [Hirsutella rhossiliensis]|uniref:Cytochrome p450 domain-containing protein n=1 Tax=Hirsutella rhossiliensis TaxID=111463 RepID=A0A9P8MT43_9HYPO|nr:cytochrome p450 domain-containing protein [Hirsutella rhossiliensis]KAH0960592.1 cytochrome p450 domain-containing protein [Hirsutella rhossiliensis]
MLGFWLLSCAVAGLLWFLATPLRTGLWSIPGPWWRRYTDIFQALDAYNGRTCQVIKRMQEEYGPVVAVGPRTVIFSDPAMIDKVYATRNPFPKSHHWMPLRTELKGVHYPSLIASEETQTHASLKRPIAGVYAMSNVVKSEAFIDENIFLLVRKLNQEYNGKGKSLPVFSWMHYFAYDTIMKLTVSNDFGLIKGEADREGMFKGVDAAQTYRAMASCMPWVHALLKGSPVTKVFERRMGSFPKRARELIQARRANGAKKINDGREDLLSQILETRKKHPEIVDERVVHGYVTTPLLAGADTVTIGLTSVVYFVGKHPEVAMRLHKELESSGLPMPPPWAAVQKLPYLDAVIREAFRSVAVSGYTTHFNTDIYGDDVNEFRPERWLQSPTENGDDYAERMRQMNKADLTWGHGDRACMGKNIARCEMYKLMATLYSVFDIRLVDPTNEWRIKETVLAKQEGVEAMISLRSDAAMQRLVENTKDAQVVA